eukprot:EG_transcript_8011
MATPEFSSRSSSSSFGPDADSHKDSPFGGRFPAGADTVRLDRSSSFTSDAYSGDSVPTVPFSWLRDGHTGLETVEASELSVGGRKESLVKGPGRKTSVIPDPASLGTGSGVYTKEYVPGEVTLAKHGFAVDAQSPVTRKLSFTPLDSPVMDVVWETASEARQKASPVAGFPSPTWSQTSSMVHNAPNRPFTPTKVGLHTPTSQTSPAAPSALHNPGASRRSSSVHFAEPPVLSPPPRRTSLTGTQSEGSHYTDWSVFLASQADKPSVPKNSETKVTTYISSYSEPYALGAGPTEWTTHEVTYTSDSSAPQPTRTSRSYSTTSPTAVRPTVPLVPTPTPLVPTAAPLVPTQLPRRPASISSSQPAVVTRQTVVEQDWSVFNQTSAGAAAPASTTSGSGSDSARGQGQGQGQFSSAVPSWETSTVTTSLPGMQSVTQHSVRRSSHVF